MKNFSTNYKNEADILNYAIPDLKSIAHLIECFGAFIEENGATKNQDISTAYFLGSLLSDITRGINDCLDKNLETK